MNNNKGDMGWTTQLLDILEEMHPEAACALEHENVFQLVVAVALSAQTTDLSVNKVTPALFAAYPTPEKLAAADIKDVENIIRRIGLYKSKAANIIKMAAILAGEYSSEVPCDMNELMRLPGVGRKTANVVMAEGFGIPAIAVDTHVFRVSNRIGLTDAADVRETEKQLMACIPRERWIRAHHLLIFHGRKCCTARKPNCAECGLNEICIYNNSI